MQGRRVPPVCFSLRPWRLFFAFFAVKGFALGRVDTSAACIASSFSATVKANARFEFCPRQPCVGGRKTAPARNESRRSIEGFRRELVYGRRKLFNRKERQAGCKA